MPSEGIFILVEGNDDERLVQNIFEPIFLRNYDWVKIWQYSQKTNKKIRDFLNVIKKGFNADCIFMADMDLSPCVRERKDNQIKEIDLLESGDIQIVIKEIEGWYCAGVKEIQDFNLGRIDCNMLTKEQLNDLILNNFSSRIDYFQEVIKMYDLNMGVKYNLSLLYFCQKYLGM